MKYLSGMVTMLIGIACLYGCSEKEKIELSAEEIIDNALVAVQKPMTYYGEFEGNDGEYNDRKNVYKEWARSDGKNKVKLRNGHQQTVDLYDGKQLFFYDDENHMVAALKRSYEEIDSNTSSLRLRSEFSLEFTKEQCGLSVAGTGKVAGRSVYHIISKPEGDKECIGVPEYWIDKENWMVLKKYSNYSKEQQITIQYTKVDYDAEITDEDLAFDFPESAGVNEIREPEESSVEEAREILGEFLLVPETVLLRISEITLFEGVKDHPEFTFNYMKNGKPEITVNVLPSYGDINFSSYNEIDIIEVRGRKGIITWNIDEFIYMWTEGGLRYTATSKNSSLTEDRMKEYLKMMEEPEN